MNMFHLDIWLSAACDHMPAVYWFDPPDLRPLTTPLSILSFSYHHIDFRCSHFCRYISVIFGLSYPPFLVPWSNRARSIVIMFHRPPSREERHRLLYIRVPLFLLLPFLSLLGHFFSAPPLLLPPLPPRSILRLLRPLESSGFSSPISIKTRWFFGLAPISKSFDAIALLVLFLDLIINDQRKLRTFQQPAKKIR